MAAVLNGVSGVFGVTFFANCFNGGRQWRGVSRLLNIDLFYKYGDEAEEIAEVTARSPRAARSSPMLM